MDQTTALNLPEILLQIVAYLKRQDLARCLRVCRTWYECFVPLVWGDIVVRNIDSTQQPSPEAMQRYRNHIFSLSIRLSRVHSNVMTYPKVHQLNLDMDVDHENDLSLISDIKDMFSSNPSLERLQLTGSGRSLDAALLSSLSTLPILSSLAILITRLDSEDAVTAFWDLCARLKSVELVGIQFLAKESHRLMTGMTSQQRQIRTLNLNRIRRLNAMEQLDLIKQCPFLQKLEWRPCSTNDIVATAFQEFAQSVASGTWPNLESLKLLNILGGKALQDDDAARILEGLRRVVVLSLARSNFGLLAFWALRQHFGMLRELVVRSCPAVSSTMLQEILCSCPQLEVLEGGTIHAQDVVGNGSWCCLALKTLVVHFAFGKDEQDLQLPIFGRLSNLTRLQELDVSKGRSQEPYPNGLDFRLQSGLGALVRLRQIEHVNFMRTGQQLGVEDVQWMVSSWKYLKTLSGTLNKDPDTISTLKSLLEPCVNKQDE